MTALKTARDGIATAKLVAYTAAGVVVTVLLWKLWQAISSAGSAAGHFFGGTVEEDTTPPQSPQGEALDGVLIGSILEPQEGGHVERTAAWGTTYPMTVSLSWKGKAPLSGNIELKTEETRPYGTDKFNTIKTGVTLPPDGSKTTFTFNVETTPGLQTFFDSDAVARLHFAGKLLYTRLFVVD